VLAPEYVIVPRGLPRAVEREMRLLLIASCLSMLAGPATAGVSFGNASKLLKDCSSMTDPVPYTHCLG